MAKKVVILGGGDSPERDVSLRSATAIRDAAQTAGFETSLIDLHSDFTELDRISPTTPILPILHGVGGEDGQIQQELENRQLSFLGTGSSASRAAFDKWLAKQAFVKSGIPTPRGGLVTKEEYPKHSLAQAPHILKALRNGSSIGIYLVKDPATVDTHEADKVFAFGNQALIEELIIGQEITVPVLGSEALPVIEIIPPEGQAFDYENKYNGLTQELCPPQNVSQELQLKAQQLALETHQALNCLHLSRTDIMVSSYGQLSVLEINTMPGMTDQSLYPRSAAVFGLTFPELVKKFVTMTIMEKRYTA